jgi:predicted nucleotidyltransferase
LTPLDRLLADAVRQLTEIDVRFALVGGVAVGVRTEPRFTRDLDFAVAVEADAQAENIAYQLQRRRYRLVAEVDQVARGRLGTLRFESAHEDGVVIDLLFASSGIEREVVQAATMMPVTLKVSLPVARIEHLIAMKTLSAGPARPLDAADLLQLIRAATPDQLDKARELLALITRRGFHRRRNLAKHLDAHIKRADRAR